MLEKEDPVNGASRFQSTRTCNRSRDSRPCVIRPKLHCFNFLLFERARIERDSNLTGLTRPFKIKKQVI